jgi:Kelch motif/Galactose oxidase, central domain
MKKTSFAIILAVIVGVVFFISCQKEISCENCNDKNKPPTANAGPDQVITLPTDSVLLDGTASSDPDGTISSYLWTKISGPASFTINNASAVTTLVKNLAEGIYQFELKITDDRGLPAKDIVQIAVFDPAHPNRPPVADAGTDQYITLPANSIILNASGSTDPDNNITAYLWSKISGPGMFFSDTINTIQLQVPDLPEGVYRFQLKVIDAGGLFSKDTINVTVNPASGSGCDNSNRPHVNAQLIPFGTLSQARLGMAVASAGNKIVFAGASLSAVNGSSVPDYGSSRVDIYDMITQTWSTAELSEKRSDIAAVAAGNKIFFAGGRLGDGAFDQLYSTVDIYDVSSNSWSVASLSEPRAYIAAATVGNKVFFAGGEYNANYNTTNRVDIYDLSSNAWSTATLSEPRAYISAVTVNNKVYFAGGHKEDRWYADPSDRIDIYDNATNSWSTSSLSEPMGFLTGINVADKIYWASGCTVEIRNANTGNSSIAHLFTPMGWITIDEGQNTVVKDGKIIFFRHWANSADKFDIYDIATNTWSIGVLPVNIIGASIISVNNTIYIAGGAVNGSFSNLSNQVWKLEF